MREAFGGTFLMYLLMIAIVIFVTFLAETLKYVQAFKVKNTIINYIEQYEGFNDTVKGELEGDNGYLKKVGYKGTKPSYEYITTIPQTAAVGEGKNIYCSEYGYCVKMEYCQGNIAYYRVITNITLNFTAVVGVNGLRIEIPGETRYVSTSGITCS